MRTIKASEIGTYLYCQRAWWYHRQGQASENLPEMIAGSEMHYRHGRSVLAIGCLRLLAYAMMLVALALLAIYFTEQFL
jgi:hypothetical protein